MSEATCKLLEDRILQLVERFRDLSAKRRKADEALGRLQEPLAALEAGGGHAADEDMDPGLHEIAAGLRAAIEELRSGEAFRGAEPGDENG